jgi:hypothetical protein
MGDKLVNSKKLGGKLVILAKMGGKLVNCRTNKESTGILIKTPASSYPRMPTRICLFAGPTRDFSRSCCHWERHSGDLRRYKSAKDFITYSRACAARGGSSRMWLLV